MRLRPLALATTLALAGALPAAAQTVEREHRFVFDTTEIVAQAKAGAEAARAGAEAARASAEHWRHFADEMRASMSTMFSERLDSAKVVKGAPYSADVITESNQSLADGNVISKKTSGRVFRDGEGRTRQETVVNGEAKSIRLSDPVAGTSTMLLPGSHKVIAMPRVVFRQSPSGKEGRHELQVLRFNDREIRIENGKVSLDGKEVPGKIEFEAGAKSVRIEGGKVFVDGKEFTPGSGGKRVERRVVTDEGDGKRREEVTVQVVSAGEGAPANFEWNFAPVPPMPPAPPVPPLPPGAKGERVLSKYRATTTSNLGTKEFDGVKAEGKGTSYTIPAGEIGNRNPIIVSTETWYSPELQVTVFSRTVDPRQGETIYKLANIRRAEPAADLFKVPEGYSAKGKREKG